MVKQREGGGDAAKMVVMGYNVGIIDKRREEKGKEDRGRGDKRAVENSRRKRKRLCVTYNEEKEEDSNNNSLVLSLYSDKFPSRRGAGAPAGAGPDDKPPPPGSAALAIYDQGTYTREPAGSLLGSASSLLGPGDNLKWGHSVTSHPPPPLPSILTAHHRLVTADSAVLSTFCRLDNKPPVTSAGNHFIFRTFAGLNQLQVRSTAVLE